MEMKDYIPWSSCFGVAVVAVRNRTGKDTPRFENVRQTQNEKKAFPISYSGTL